MVMMQRNNSSHQKKVRFHHTLPFMTKQNSPGYLQTAQKSYEIIDTKQQPQQN